jgi:general secretion pathway protein M
MNKIQQFYYSLEEREKIILTVGILFLAGFILVNFFMLPVINYKKELENKISSYAYQAEQIRLLGDEYRKYVKKSDLSQSQDSSDIALFSFMDSLAGKANIKDKVDYMKPSTSKSLG